MSCCLFVAWFFLFRPTILGGPTGYIMVTGTSMEPTFYTGDLVITRRQDEYRPGDVAAYRTSSGNIIHRIIEERADGRFVLLGDNKNLPDPAFPSSDEVIGKQWFLVPNGGDALNFMRQPVPFAVLLGGVTLVMFSKRKRLSQFVQRRLRMRNRRATIGSGSLVPNDQSQVMTIFGTSLAITMIFLFASVYALRQPVTSANIQEIPSFTHSLSFDYDIAVMSSTLYSGDTISSDDIAVNVADGSSGGQPVFAQLASDIELDIEYELMSEQSSDLVGDIGVSLEVSAVGGWTKSMELQQATPFSGTTADAHVTISVPEIRDLVTQIEEETGYRPSSYNVSILPAISVRGAVSDVSVDSTYTPAYTFELTTTQLSPKSDLVQTENQAIGSAPVEDNAVTLAGLDIGVQPLRVLGGTATLIGILVTGAIAATVFLGIGRGEAAKVQARFKTVFIEATGMSAPQPVSIVDVASLEDLARLAQRDGGIVFHQSVDTSSKRFFVPDGTTMYQYIAQRGQSVG